MPDISLNETEGFRAWAKLLVENEDSYFIPEAQVLLNFYNTDDSAYLVLDVYTDEIAFTQYVFIAANDDDDCRVTPLIFDLLKTHQFSLTKLLNWLKDAEFTETAAGVQLQSHGLNICRSYPKAKALLCVDIHRQAEKRFKLPCTYVTACFISC